MRSLINRNNDKSKHFTKNFTKKFAKTLITQTVTITQPVTEKLASAVRELVVLYSNVLIFNRINSGFKS